MTATIQVSSGRQSVEHLQEKIRDLETRATDIEVQKHALEAQIADLETHRPRLFKGKHKDRLQDLHIDLKYLNTKLANIASERAHYLDELPETEQNGSEPELARPELPERENGIPSIEVSTPREQPAEVPSIEVPESRYQETEIPAVEAAQTRDHEAFYRETIRPALLALVKARVADDRLAFVDGFNEVMALLGRMNGAGLNEEAQQKCRILFDYVLGFPCSEWFPGDPGPLMADLAERARTWNASVESDDAPLELALANGLMLMPLQLTRKLEKSPKAGDVRHRMKQIEETYPGALEASERKCIHVLRTADADWLRKRAEKGLDRLNQIRR